MKTTINKLTAIVTTITIALLSSSLLTGCGGAASGMSKKELESEALRYVESDYGYKLTLDSCELVSHESASVTNPLNNEKEDIEIYGILLKADANDQSGNTVDSVKYEILVKCVGSDSNPIVNVYDMSYTDDDSIKAAIEKDVAYNLE